ncbi:MAG: hypothetical protein J6D52_13865 [Clostridia bacterium]|nr:hypothetical protein [Clostridia bacterium]
MDKSLIEKYKLEMLDMYKKTKSAPTVLPTIAPQSEPLPESEGQLVAIVTSLRGIYPVENAKVTVFTGNYGNMQVLDTAYTDQSGRTRPFVLQTPNKQISLESDNKGIAYATYNLEVKAEGYVDNVHINIPVFSGVTSLQSSNLMLLETAGVDKGPQIFDESARFDLG